MNNLNLTLLLSAMRTFMVPASVSLLSINYIIAAWVQGFFILTIAPELGAVLSYAIGAAIQGTRGLLVFMGMMDKSRPDLSVRGEIVAAVMGIGAVYEIYHLNGLSGISTGVALSLGVLMVSGFLVEFALLKSLKGKAAELFFKTSANADKLMRLETNKTNLKVFLKALPQVQATIVEAQQAKIKDSLEKINEGQAIDLDVMYKSLVPNGTKARIEV